MKDSINKCTDISNEIDSLSSIQFEIKETSKGIKHVNNSNDKKCAKELFVLYLCSNFQHSFLAGHADEIIDQEHLCMKSESE